MAKNLFAWKVSHNEACNICGNQMGTTSPKLICSSCNRHLNMRNSEVSYREAKQKIA